MILVLTTPLFIGLYITAFCLILPFSFILKLKKQRTQFKFIFHPNVKSIILLLTFVK